MHRLRAECHPVPSLRSQVAQQSLGENRHRRVSKGVLIYNEENVGKTVFSQLESTRWISPNLHDVFSLKNVAHLSVLLVLKFGNIRWLSLFLRGQRE